MNPITDSNIPNHRPNANQLSALPWLSIENIKQNNGRTLFIFQESPELRSAILDFANDAAIAVRSFCSTMRDLKAITRVLIFFFAALAGVNPAARLAQTKTQQTLTKDRARRR